ncbi:MAG: hypothetical protein IJ654_01740 [Bacteroidales bacterium]|nr:hypothetical protein [Bacteroidales bacterium]
MSEKKTVKTALLAAIFALGALLPLRAQSGAGSAHTPYSVFGVGDVIPQGTAYHKAMGGTGVASRNRKVINYMNPAALTARDSLAFMVDFSLMHADKLYRQQDLRSGANLTNLNDIVISFPIYHHSAMMLGAAPYSGLGYGFSSYATDPDLVGHVGNVAYSSAGTGGLYQIFAGAGVTLWRRLSLGAEYIYYFGKMQKASTVTYTTSGYNGVSSGYEFNLSGHTAKFGLQYEQPLGSLTLVMGATYTLGTNLKGSVRDYKLSTGSLVTDTLRNNINDFSKDKAGLAGELTAGVSLRSGERWRAEVDYSRSDWTHTGMDKVTGFANTSGSVFSATAAQSVRAGFEFIPNINDVRYYMRRVSYKAGTYLNKEYFLLDGNQIWSAGLTFGITLPISNQNTRMNNGLSLSMDVGQRGRLQGNLVRERYIGFTIGLNAFDIWFQKNQYL